MNKFISTTLLATTLTPALADNPVDLPDVVVTATRTETETRNLAAATTVYTRADIEKYQVNTLPELLQRTTGIDMVQNGGLGKNTSIFMRGTNSKSILVLIDGVRAGSVTTGTTPFQYIPIDQIERIEIIRGPQSSLYGSEAIGGVIQIFTRKGKQSETPSITLDAGGGSYDTLQKAGSVSGKYKDAWYSLSASHINTQGFNARETGSIDKDGYYNTGLNARAGYHFSEDTEIEAFYTRANGKTDFDDGVTEFTNQTVGLNLKSQLTEAWKAELLLGQTRDDNNNLGTFFSVIDTTRWNASWVNTIQLAEDHTFITGTDYRHDEVEGSINYGKDSRYDVGIFGALHSHIFDNHYITASLRWDENEAFGDYVTGNFGWRFNWDYGLSAFASFGNAFRAPSFNELYYPGFGTPSLEAEESTSFEVGISGSHDWANWEIRAYHTNIDNLISGFPAENVDKAQINGIETEISTTIFGWHNKLGFQLLSPKDRIDNSRLPARAEKILNYDLGRSFGNFDIGGSVLARGDSYAAFSNNKVSGFVTVDLRSAYHFNKNWTIRAKLNNLLDKQYQLVDTYNTADRNFFVSIHYKN